MDHLKQRLETVGLKKYFEARLVRHGEENAQATTVKEKSDDAGDGDTDSDDSESLFFRFWCCLRS